MGASSRARRRVPPGTTDEQTQVKLLERAVRKLRRANEILRKASAYFAPAELDRRAKLTRYVIEHGIEQQPNHVQSLSRSRRIAIRQRLEHR